MPDYASHRELSIDLMRHHKDAPPGTMDLLSPLPALLIDIAALIAGGYRNIFFRKD